MAEHIVSRRDWTAATVEMGVNMLGDDEALFRSRVRRFCEILKQDGRPVFTTDIFRLGGEDGGKIENFRRIVQ